MTADTCHPPGRVPVEQAHAQLLQAFTQPDPIRKSTGRADYQRGYTYRDSGDCATVEPFEKPLV